MMGIPPRKQASVTPSLHFGVDIDGVLAAHLLPMLEVIRDLLGIHLTPDDVKDYYFDGQVPREELERIFDRCMDEAFQLQPTPGYELVNALPGKVSIVTHRPAEKAEAVTRAWLAHHGIRFDDLLFTKGRKSQMGTFDFFVDDHPRNVEELASEGITTFMMLHPYNRDCHFGEHDHRVIRVANWHEISTWLTANLEVQGLARGA